MADAQPTPSADTHTPKKRSSKPPQLLEYLDEMVESLRTLVPAALKDFDEQAIHKARVATRRLKASLDLMKPTLSDDRRKPFATIGRKLRRRLGPLRDLDVMIDHLADLAKKPGSSQAATWVSDHLHTERDKAREKSGEGISPGHVLARLGSWWRVREEMEEASEAIGTLLAESLHLQLDRFAEQADELAGVRIVKHDAGAPQDPHELRIAGKALRYTMEMAQVHGHKLPAKVMRAFKRMQELLGAWHDDVVLTERALGAGIAELLPHHNPDLQQEILKLARLTLERSKRELQQFGKLWKENGATLTETIRAAFPLTKPASSESTSAPAPVELPPSNEPAAP